MELEEVYHANKELVYNLALHYVQNEEDAQEITQDVFVSVYHSLDSFNHNSKISTWIYRITIHKSLDFLRSKKRKKRFALLISLVFTTENKQKEIAEFNHPGVQLEQKESVAMIFKCINQLPENQKTALILSKIEGKSHKEIAEIMSLSSKAVESLVQRAKTKLLSKLNEGNEKEDRLT